MIPGSGRSSEEGNGNPLQYYLGNPMDRGAWGLQFMGSQSIRHDLVTKQQQQIRCIYIGFLHKLMSPLKINLFLLFKSLDNIYPCRHKEIHGMPQQISRHYTGSHRPTGSQSPATSILQSNNFLLGHGEVSELPLLLLSRFSRVRLLATPWTAAYQAPPSMGFSRQEYWSGVPLPSPE